MVFGCGEGCGPKKKASEKVSEAAKELFYRRGIRAVGVDEIVNQAGVTKPSLYRTYPSKDDLITACLREHAAENRARWDEALARAPGNPRAQLSELFQTFAGMMANGEFRGCPISNAAVEFPCPEHPAHQFALEMKRETTERWLSLVSQLGVRDPEALTDGLLLLLEGAATACQSYGCDGPARSFVTTAEALVDSYMGTAQRV